MSRFTDERFVDAWVEAINGDSEFAETTRWFDGSMLLDDEGAQCWLKVYGGRIIDRMPFMPPMGYTFKLSAPRWAWDELAGGTVFSDLLLGGRRRFSGPQDITDDANLQPGAFALEGDTMAGFRIIGAIYRMADHYRAVAQSAEVTA